MEETKKKTLEDILNESEPQDAKGMFLKLGKYIMDQDKKELEMTPSGKKLSELEDKMEELASSFSQAMKTITATLEKIANRPDPKFPEQQPFPEKMSMDKPAWYADQDHETSAIMAMKLIAPLIDALGKRMDANHQDIKSVSMDILNKEPELHEPEPEKPAKKDGKNFPMNSGIGSVRRRARWEIATYPAINGKASLTAKGDGMTFYLPSMPIINSENVRLNGGNPLSNGVDYNLNSNALVFTEQYTDPLIEVRYQS